MRVKSITYLLLLLLAVSAVSCFEKPEAAEGKKRILVLSQLDNEAQIWRSMMHAFNEEFADTSRYSIRCRLADDPAYKRILVPEYFHDASRHIGNILNKETVRPDLVITIGDALSHSAAMSDHPLLSDVPVLCIDVMDPEWNGLIRKRANFVVMGSRPSVKENVDFIRSLGGTSWIITGLDSTYIDDCLRESIMEQIGNDTAHYITNLQLETYERLIIPEARDSVRSTLIPIDFEHNVLSNTDTLHNKYFTRQGLLRCQNNQCTFLRLKDDAYIDSSLGHNLGSFFTGTPTYFNLTLLSALNGCIGGYFTPWPEMLRQAHPVIDKLLDGEDPSTLPWTTLDKQYWLDWRLARKIHPYAEDFPVDVNFVNLPWRYESRLNDILYRRWLPTGIALIALLFTAVPIILFFKNRKQNRTLIEHGRRAMQNKKKIEDVLAATNSYYWELMPDNTVLLSDEFRKAFGAKNRRVGLETLLGMYHQPGRDKLRALLNDESISRASAEVLATIPSTGEEHAFITYVNRLTGEDGGVRRVGFSVLDDEGYQAEITRKDAYRLSEEANVKESFLAAMSHEIRSPLNAIVGFAEILSQQYDMLSDEERVAYGQYINDSKDQLVRLLEDVISYSGKNDERPNLELTRKDVSKLMDEVFFMHTVIVPHHLRFRYVHGENAKIMTNRSAVLQIMSNLMNNAIKFTEEGSITLGWEVVDGYVLMYVEDTGIGIAPDKQEHIFEQYFKTNARSVGAGLGLSLCRQLAENIQASLSVVSTPGKGSRFNLKIKVV